MTKLLTLAAALGAGLVLGGAANAGPVSKKAYDGTWSVVISTESGPCDRSYSYAVAIEDGRVQQASSSDGTVISGTIASDGSVGLGLLIGPASADASGRLRAMTGSGTWKLPMLGCSGSWTAQKRGTRHANAS